MAVAGAKFFLSIHAGNFPTRYDHVYHVGFDDTDSSDGMCTTFLCYNLVKEFLSEKQAELLDYPNLVRLNPNIPWKTRGNAALALRIASNSPKEEVFELCKSFVVRYATSPRANSGLLLFEGFQIPKEIQDFSKRALYSVLSVRQASELAERFDLLWLGLRSKQGLVGALAAIGNVLAGDHTYELIAYRQRTDVARKIDRSRVLIMNSTTFPNTFSSYDPAHDRIMIAPHGPDPVLCGIRGETALDVKKAFSSILPIENLAGYMIFRSNQGTGEHLREPLEIGPLKAYSAGNTIGVVSSRPRIERGGHVFFKISSGNNEIPCACYEPTGELRKSALALIPGDLLEVGGGVRKSTSVHPKILNVEYLRPIKLAKKFRLSNPKCQACGTSMTSKGRHQGFACRSCGAVSKDATKTEIFEERHIELGLYLPPIKAHRHLTKPMHRYSLQSEKKHPLPVKFIDGWIS